jgi:hypothetical protein
MSVIETRAENRRSDCSLPVDIRRGFRRVTSVRFGLVMFPAARLGRLAARTPAALIKQADSQCRHANARSA